MLSSIFWNLKAFDISFLFFFYFSIPPATPRFSKIFRPLFSPEKFFCNNNNNIYNFWSLLFITISLSLSLSCFCSLSLFSVLLYSKSVDVCISYKFTVWSRWLFPPQFLLCISLIPALRSLITTHACYYYCSKMSVESLLRMLGFICIFYSFLIIRFFPQVTEVSLLKERESKREGREKESGEGEGGRREENEAYLLFFLQIHFLLFYWQWKRAQGKPFQVFLFSPSLKFFASFKNI